MQSMQLGQHTHAADKMLGRASILCGKSDTAETQQLSTAHALHSPPIMEANLLSKARRNALEDAKSPELSGPSQA